jgi:hypothetical protein
MKNSDACEPENLSTRPLPNPSNTHNVLRLYTVMKARDAINDYFGEATVTGRDWRMRYKLTRSQHPLTSSSTFPRL